MSDPVYEVFPVILAAGRGRRMGGVKPMTHFARRPLLEWALMAASGATGRRPWVVSGAHSAALLSTIAAFGGAMVENPDFDSGMGSSIAAGIAALPDSATHCLLSPVDQPLVDAAALSTLVTASRMQPSAIVVSAWQDRSGDRVTGPPVVFPRAVFSQLLALQGDAGAREVVADYEHVVRIRVAAAAWDIDTPTALRRLELHLRDQSGGS